MAKSLHILLGTSACLQWLCHSGERTVARGPLVICSPEHEVLKVSCGQLMSLVHRAASTIAIKAHSSYTPGQIDSKLSRKHRGDL